jgi:hypothetical protein
MGNVWTCGTWTVKPGREDAFAAAWRELAHVAIREFDLPEPPRFLRDRDQPNVFVAFGPWDDAGSIARFRELVGARAARLDELVESGEARILDEVGLDD